jgi:RNA 3'-terminal phosphate cyclase
VRLSKAKRTFKRGYIPNWTQELLTVVKSIETRPPVYLIKDDLGEILEGTFYSETLQKVIKKDDVYKIEMILKKRKKGRRVQYLVKWLGYPDTFNSWIFKQDLQKRVTLPK